MLRSKARRSGTMATRTRGFMVRNLTGQSAAQVIESGSALTTAATRHPGCKLEPGRVAQSRAGANTRNTNNEKTLSARELGRNSCHGLCDPSGC